jgi:uncharacterized protein (TIGR02588 family)
VTRAHKNWLEWTVFALSAVLILAVAGVLGYLAVAGERRNPRLEVSLGTPERVPSGYAVPVTVTNTGDITAEEVVVEVRVEGGDERGELTLAFVPGGSRRQGWVAFTREPDVARLRTRLIGYEQP